MGSKNVKRWIFLFSLYLISYFSFLSPTVNAEAGNSGLTFLNLGIGARAIGMGSAFTGQADDVSASYWNPGGLTQVQGMEVLTMYDSYFEGMSHIYLGGCKQLVSGDVVGGHINYFTTGNIPLSNTNGDKVGDMKIDDMAITFSYAHSMSDLVSLGGNVKVVQESFGSKGGSGLAVDGGMMYRKSDDLKLGFALFNLGSGIAVNNETITFPMNIKGGVSYSLAGQGYPIVVNGDIGMIVSDGSLVVNFGSEYVYENIGLRVGLNNTNAGTFPSLGIGLNQNNLLIDIGAIMNGELGSTFKVSLTGKFDVAGNAKTNPVKKAKKFSAASAGSVTTDNVLQLKSEQIKNLEAQKKQAIDSGAFEKAKELKNKIEELKSK